MAHGLDVIAGPATSVRHPAIKIDCANEFFERRSLQDDSALAISHEAGAIKDHSVISTDQVYENDWQAGGLSPVRNHFATHAELAFIKGRRID